jgi:hypothetical protein
MLVDSKTKKLTVPEIVAIATKQTKSQYSPAAVLASVYEELKQPQTYSIIEGNTLFVIHKGKGRNGMFRALNADTPQNYLNNSLVFSSAAYKLGFDNLITQFRDKSLLNIFRFVEKNSSEVNPNMGFNVRKAENGDFVVSIKLGPERAGE